MFSLTRKLVSLKGLCWNLTPITVNSWLNIYLQLSCVTSKNGKTSNFSIPNYSQPRFVEVAQGIDGAHVEKVLEMASITANKNTCPGDKSALKPGGLRLGAPALTSRNFKEEDFVKVIEYLDRGVKIAVEAQSATGDAMKDFLSYIESNPETKEKIDSLRADVESFARGFTMPGFESR